MQTPLSSPTEAWPYQILWPQWPLHPMRTSFSFPLHLDLSCQSHWKTPVQRQWPSSYWGEGSCQGGRPSGHWGYILDTRDHQWGQRRRWQGMTISHLQSWEWSLKGQQRNISSLLLEGFAHLPLEKWVQEIDSIFMEFTVFFWAASCTKRHAIQHAAHLCESISMCLAPSGEIYVQRKGSHFWLDPGRGCL